MLTMSRPRQRTTDQDQRGQDERLSRHGRATQPTQASFDNSCTADKFQGYGLSRGGISDQDQCGRFGAGGVVVPVGLPTGRTPKLNKLALTIVGTVVVALAIAGCGSRTPAALPTATVSPTANIKPSALPWTSRFTSAQVTQIEKAIGVINASRVAVARLTVDDATAKAVFNKYYATPSVPEAQLKQAIADGIKTTGIPVVLWTRPVRFSPFHGAKDKILTIDQCVDNSKVKTTVGAKPAKYAYNSRRQEAEWVLYRTTRGWLIGASGSKSSC